MRKVVFVLGAGLAVILGGCSDDAPTENGALSSPTTAVTAPNPAKEYYDLLKRLDPNQIPDSMRRDYSAVFDPATGELIDFSQVYQRAAAVGCNPLCIESSYREMVYGLHLRD